MDAAAQSKRKKTQANQKPPAKRCRLLDDAAMDSDDDLCGDEEEEDDDPDSDMDGFIDNSEVEDDFDHVSFDRGGDHRDGDTPETLEEEAPVSTPQSPREQPIDFSRETVLPVSQQLDLALSPENHAASPRPDQAEAALPQHDHPRTLRLRDDDHGEAGYVISRDIHSTRAGHSGLDPSLLVQAEEHKVSFRSHFLGDELDRAKLDVLSEPTLRRLLEEFHTDAKSAVARSDQGGFLEFFDLASPPRNMTVVGVKSILAKFLHGVVYLMQCCRMSKIIGQDTDDMRAQTQRFNHIFQIIQCGADRLVSDLQITSLRSGEAQADEVNLFGVSPPDPDKQTPWQKLILFILQSISQCGYRRYQGACYKEIKIAHCYNSDGDTFYEDHDNVMSPGVSELCTVAKTYKTHSWKYVYDISRAIYQLVDKNRDYDRWLDLTSSPGNAASTINYLKNCMDPEFPDLVPNRLARSYRNGVMLLDMGAEIFYSFQNLAVIPKNLVCCNHYDQEFDSEIWDINHWYNIQTPAFQMILEDQHLDKPVQLIMYAMLGRLLYKVNAVDKWQVILFIKGVAQSGKSTIGKIAKLFFKAEDVAVMSSNIEQKFGLEPISNMMLFICFEVTKAWSLPRSDFQSLISGEELSLAGKHKTARTIQWEVPGLLLGNELGPWVDAAGSIVRRLLVTEFQHKIHKSDPNLDEKLQAELPNLIFKCQQAYSATCVKFQASSIWENIPSYFKQIQERIASSTNPIREFIETSKVVYLAKDAMMPLYVFDDRFREYNRRRSQKPQNFSMDEYTHIFNDMGIITKHMRTDWHGSTHGGSFLIGIDLAESSGMNEDNFEHEQKKEGLDKQRTRDENAAFEKTLRDQESHTITCRICDIFPLATTNYFINKKPPILVSAKPRVDPGLLSDSEGEPDQIPRLPDARKESYKQHRWKRLPAAAL